MRKRQFLPFILSICLFAGGKDSAYAYQSYDPPAGFNLIISEPGVSLYKKEYAGGNPDFVQIIDLSRGASLQLLYSDIKKPRSGRGVYGGDDPYFEYWTIQDFWNTLSSEFSQAFCISNGQFFFMQESPTRLPFPLKVDGEIISDGYADQEFIGEKLLLAIWSDHAEIIPLTKENLYSTSAPDILGGLSETANKAGKHFTGRTFIGLDDPDNDGRYQHILLFNTKTARQVDAIAVLNSFGVDQTMMLDGGGSTQLLCQGESLISSDRYIPQALGVVAGLDQAVNIIPATINEKEIITIPKVPTSFADMKISSTSDKDLNLMDVFWVAVLMVPIQIVILAIIFRHRLKQTK
jgi:hypothetical protein